MRTQTGNRIYIILTTMVMAAIISLVGCGGGGSGGAQAPTLSGSGKVSATINLTGRVGGRFVAESATATVNVAITISGIYSGTNTEFSPVTTMFPVNLAQGYARVSVVNVPIGVNHMLTAVADWGGAVETVKAIIPNVSQNEIVTVTADSESTVVADTTIYYAERNNVQLTDVGSDTIASIGNAVAAYSTQVSYADMTPENVLAFLQGMNVPSRIDVSPASATIVIGGTMQFTAQLYDSNNTLMSASSIIWNSSPPNIGIINNIGGLFTALVTGSGTVTASYLQLNAAVPITVISVCAADADCNDGLPLTLDACNNPGSLNGYCSYATIACNTNADCNDNQALTIDACSGGGTVSATCSHAAFECNNAQDCDDNDMLTIDTCANGGAPGAACAYNSIACNTDADCMGALRACLDGGSISAACIACISAADCDDGNTLTLDTCVNAGTVSAVCANTTSPTVTAVVPLNNATEVSINTKVTATFSEVMDPATITTTTFTLKQGATPVSGAVTYTGITAVFTPDSYLMASTLYTVTITTGAKDLTGDALAASYTWSFTTGAAPDTSAPAVTLTAPANSAVGVQIGNSITATFIEAMDPLTITTSTFTLMQGTTPVPGNVTYSGITAVFIPVGNLDPNTLYTATITSGATDLAGNALAANYAWNFTTGATADITAPTVTLTVPANTDSAAPIGNKLTATFNEAMNPLTITTTTFVLKQGTTPVSGAVTYSGVNAVFTPVNNLSANTIYTATITTGATDLAGNALAANYAWSFTTGATADITAPTVTLTVPANTDSAAPIGNKLTATFNEAMNPLTITTTTFVLMQGTTPVSGAVTYSGVNAVFTPVNNLSANTIYTATITTGATDLAGNALAANYAWNFTTGAAPDATAPTVTLTVPINAASGVPISGVPTDSKLTATFNEAMDPLTITTTTFTLKQGSTPVSGAVNYSGVNAVFTPTSDLTPNTLYTVTITIGARDLAGNALAASYSASFTTGVAPDTTAPAVILTVPLNGATGGEPIHHKDTATFSEAMDPLTITTTTFTLKQGSTPVSGSVTYSGVTAVFAADSNLSPNMSYTATITTGARDLAGNALASNYVWTFSTASGGDATAPTVNRTVPANAATGICINKTISSTFSEPMDPLTISTANFTVSGVTGTVVYNALTMISTFTPTSNLAPNTLYTATITSRAKDLAGNGLAVNKVWTFTTGTTTCTTQVVLGAATPLGGFGGGTGITNTGTLTIISGDIATTGVSNTVTGFHDSAGDIYTVTGSANGLVNGRIYTAAPPPGGAGVGGNSETFVIATAAANDTLTAYNNMSPASLPGGVDPGAGQLGGLTLAPGIYKAAGGTFLLTGSDLTLDGQGDPNAVWVFQTAAGLTIGAPGFPRSINLINGASARNVFWYVGAVARIEDRCNMVGTIIAGAGVTISTAGQASTTTLEGRALGLNASVTMVNTVINVPALYLLRSSGWNPH